MGGQSGASAMLVSFQVVASQPRTGGLVCCAAKSLNACAAFSGMKPAGHTRKPLPVRQRHRRVAFPPLVMPVAHHDVARNQINRRAQVVAGIVVFARTLYFGADEAVGPHEHLELTPADDVVMQRVYLRGVKLRRIFSVAARTFVGTQQINFIHPHMDRIGFKRPGQFVNERKNNVVQPGRLRAPFQAIKVGIGQGAPGGFTEFRVRPEQRLHAPAEGLMAQAVEFGDQPDAH